MKNKKVFRPHKLCLILLAVCIAVLLAGQCFLRAGYPRDSISLDIQSGDASQLQGFDLQGVWRQNEDAALEFSLQDGGVTVSPQLSGQCADGLPLMLQNTLCVPDAEIPAVDAQAEGGATRGYSGAFFLRSGYSGMQYTAMSDRLEMICTLRVTDGTDRSVRFSLGAVQLAQPETVMAQLYDGNRTDDAHSYLVNNNWLTDENAALLPDISVLSNREQVRLYVGPHGEEPGGIYVVREYLTREQVLEQVSDVQVHGVEVLSQTQPYGKIEETCSFEQGERLADCQDWVNARLADGRQFLLTVDENNRMYLRILDSEGRSAGRLPLDMTVEAGQKVAILPAMRKDEAIFTVTGEDGGAAMVLRIQDDSVTAAKTWTVQAGQTLLTAGFNEDASKLMTVYEKTETLRGTVPSSVQRYYKTDSYGEENRDCEEQVATGWQIEVCATQDLDTPVVAASLEFGIPQQGRVLVWWNGLYGEGLTPSFCKVMGAWQNTKEDAQ